MHHTSLYCRQLIDYQLQWDKKLAPLNRGGSSVLHRLEYHTVVRTKLDTTLTAVGKNTPRKNHKPAEKTGAVQLQRKDASLLKGSCQTQTEQITYERWVSVNHIYGM
jgi:hypothetical protein